jgi:hypothetical protein
MSDVGFAACAPLLDEPGHPGMVWRPGDRFRMSFSKHYPEDAPNAAAVDTSIAHAGFRCVIKRGVNYEREEG